MKAPRALPAVLVFILTVMSFGQNRAVSTDIVAAASRSVVLLKGVTDSGAVLGSGFILSPDGKIATNLHVIRGMKSGGVQLASGEVYDSLLVLAFDDRRDLAIVKIAGFDLPVLELGNSNDVQPGEPVIAIGSPNGLQGTVTAGVVSAIRDDPSLGGYKVIQTDVAANPGNSGGPLLNSKGQAIGVVTSKVRSSEGLNFAVPINYVRGLMESPAKLMTLAELRVALSAEAVDVFKTLEPFPANWKSMTTGNRYKIRKEPGVVYVERVLSDAEKQVGNFANFELKKGKDRYSGNEHMVITGAYLDHDFKHWTQRQVINRCSFDFPVEVSVFSESRIELRVLFPRSGSKLDIKKCAYDKTPDWQTFVWIPE
jgi:S1-C subfamily serine protease